MENKNINTWLELAEKQPIPVLKHTIIELRNLCGEEEIPLKEITHLVERDPGLVVHILRSSNNRPKGRLSTEITHINQAFSLMGIDQLTSIPDILPAVGDVLNEQSKRHILECFDKAYLAARFATDWATIRRDMTPDEVFAATQLHFLGDMILAMYSPELLDQIAHIIVEDHLASVEAEYLVLGFTLNELSLKLAESWQLPTLVKEALHAENASTARAYGIMLGVQLARSIAYKGWYSRSTHDTQKKVAEWMGIKLGIFIARTHKIAAEVARETPQYDTPPAARLLPLIIDAEEEYNKEDKQAAICLIPKLSILRTAIQELPGIAASNATKDDVIQHIITAMHDGIGLNRVVFCLYDKEEKIFNGYILKGTENDPIFSRFRIRIDNNLFSLFTEKPRAILMNESTREDYWPLISSEFHRLIKTNSFIAMSIFVADKPFGLFYADRHTSSCQLDKRSYNYFKTLCLQATKIISKLPD